MRWPLSRRWAARWLSIRWVSNMHLDSDARKKALCVIAIFCPVVAVFIYPQLSFIPDLPWGYRHAVAPALYGFCVASVATLFEFRTLQRIVSCLLVAVFSSLNAATFDVVFILGVALVTGLIAVGAPEYSPLYDASSRIGRLASQVLYRIIRAAVVGASATGAIFLVCLLLPPTGKCPASGGDITGAFGRFTFITYAFVVSAVVFDWRAANRE